MLIAVGALEMALKHLGHRFRAWRGRGRGRAPHRRGGLSEPMAETTMRVLLSDPLNAQGVEVFRRYPQLKVDIQDWTQARRSWPK